MLYKKIWLITATKQAKIKGRKCVVSTRITAKTSANREERSAWHDSVYETRIFPEVRTASQSQDTWMQFIF